MGAQGSVAGWSLSILYPRSGAQARSEGGKGNWRVGAIKASLTDSVLKTSLDSVTIDCYDSFMRKKCYDSVAEKQKAYRLRKAQEHHQTEEHPPVVSGKFLVADPARDPKIWAYAVVRAERAKGYAGRLPEFIRPADLVFQDPLWQYERELRFAKQFTH